MFFVLPYDTKLGGGRAINDNLYKYFKAEPTAITRQGGIMKFLESLLSEETLKELNEKLGADLVKSVDDKLGDFKISAGKEKLIPKSVYDTDKNELKQQIENRDKQLKELADKVKDNDSLSQEIEALRASNKKDKEDYESRLTAQAQSHAYDKALAGFKPKNVKALSGVIDKSKLVYKEQDGEFIVEGLKEQVEALKKTDSYLFEGTTPTPNPQNPQDPDPNVDDAKLRSYFGLDAKK